MSATLFNWLFVDMDGFFASVERVLDPSLADKPVGVIPVATDHTCVIACTYDAKQRGVRVGTPVPEARALCPGIVLREARPDVYVRVHHAVAASIDRVLPIGPALSIDEWAIGLRGADRVEANAKQLAVQIQGQLRRDFGPSLTCSVGIGPTRLLAKIASDLKKPGGIVALAADSVPQMLSGLRPRDLCGISKGLERRLLDFGVESLEQLWALTRPQAKKIWGSVVGAEWWDGMHGHDRPVIPTRRRSMSHAHVLDPSRRTAQGARSMAARLVTRLGVRLRSAGLLTSRLVLDVRGRKSMLEIEASFRQTDRTRDLISELVRLWDGASELPDSPSQVGVCVRDLVAKEGVTPGLFSSEVIATARDRRLDVALDEIIGRWGVRAGCFGAVCGSTHEMDEKIAFGRIPELRRTDSRYS